jgi:hypothetical protein
MTCADSVANRMIRQSILSFSQTDAGKAYESSLNAGATLEQARSGG